MTMPRPRLTEEDGMSEATGRPGTESSPASGQSAMPGQRTTSAEADTVEISQLRAEVEALRGQIVARERRGHRMLVARRVVAAVLVVVAAFGTAASVVGLWAARTTLDTDRWVSTVAPLPSDPDVATAVSIYVTDEMIRVLDVEDRIADALPPEAAFIAAPVTGAVRDYIQGTVEDVVQSDRFAALWENVNRTSHEQILAIVEGESQAVVVREDRVTLNLLPVVNNVLATLEDRAPTLFGRTLNLPEITDGQVPAGLETRIETALGVDLPDNFSQITIYSADEVSALQDAVALFKKYLVLLVIGTLLVLALALWVSPWRRRTILQFGVWVAIAVLTVGSILRAVRRQIVESVPAGDLRQGADAAADIIFATLRERGDQVLWAGIAIAVVAYLVGPGRAPSWLRRTIATGARAAWGWVHGLATGSESALWVRRQVDALRIAGVVVAGVLALLLSSWTSLFVLLVLLGAYELAVTLIARPSSGEAVPEGEEAEGGPSPEGDETATPEERPLARAGSGDSDRTS
jgi:hypothetical protein